MVSFIDEHRETLGVEPICKALQVAPSTYYAAKSRQPSPRAMRDAMLKNDPLRALDHEPQGLWRPQALARRAPAGHDIGRDQVARLMRELGIRGVSKCRKKVFTTRSDPDAGRPPDLVKRDFSAAHPNGLWVTDLTYVPTRTGMAYVCFITDAFSRMIVGWRVAAHMRTDMVLDALEMARTFPAGRSLRRPGDPFGRRDRNSLPCASPSASTRSERRPSIGTVADSFDNALAEAINGLYKTECVYGPDTNGWDDVSHLELATLSWVHWFNEERLHGYCGDIPPAEFEAAFYAGHQPALPGLGNQ